MDEPVIRKPRHSIPMEDRLPMDGSGSEFASIEQQTSLKALRDDLAGRNADDHAANLVEQIMDEGDEEVTSLPRAPRPGQPMRKPVRALNEDGTPNTAEGEEEAKPLTEEDELLGALTEEEEGAEPQEGAEPDALDETEVEFELDPEEEGGEKVKTKVKVADLKATYKEAKVLRTQVQEAQAEMEQIPLKVHQQMEEQRGTYIKALQGYQAALVKMVAPEFEGVDMQALARDNPAEYVRVKARADSINQTLQQLQQEEEHQLQAQAQEGQKARAYAVTRSKAILQKEIKGWSDEKYQTILKGAVKLYGFNPKEVAGIIDPRVIKMANDAAEYNRLKERAASVKKKVSEAPPVRPTIKSGPTRARQPGQGAKEAAKINFLKNRSSDDAAAAFLDSLGI